MIEIRHAQWFDGLRDRQAKTRIDLRIRRLSLSNPGDVKPVREGVSELRIDYADLVIGSLKTLHTWTIAKRPTYTDAALSCLDAQAASMSG